jgi:hypothetical protein
MKLETNIKLTKMFFHDFLEFGSSPFPILLTHLLTIIIMMWIHLRKGKLLFFLQIQCWEYKYCTTRSYMILHYKINEWYTRYITYSTLQDTYIILHCTIHTWYWTVQIRTLYWTVRSIGAWIGLWRREENAFEMTKEFAFWFLVAYWGFFSLADSWARNRRYRKQAKTVPWLCT